MKAIQTKYVGPTDTKGGRVRAWDMDGNTVTIPYPHGAWGGTAGAHRVAAEALCKKMQWTGKIVGGGIKGGYVFVFVESDI